MGSVFAGRMILDVALYSSKKCQGWGGRSPAVRKWTASMMGLKSSLAVVRVKPANGAMFLKASLHGVERKRGGLGGRSPPHLQTQPLCHGF